MCAGLFARYGLQDVQNLLSRGASDAHREAAALKEQQLVLKLQAGKLGRAELLMRQKVRQGSAS